MKDIKQLAKVLVNEYGEDNWWESDSDFNVLVAIILSQSTGYKNVIKAMKLFRKRFKNERAVVNARLSDIKRTIRPAGLYNMKAPRIKSLAKALVEGEGLKKNCEDELR